MGEVIPFQRAESDGGRQRPRPEVAEGTRDRSRYADNQFTRRSLIRQFLLGAGLRQVGKRHPGGETGFAQDVREAILGDGGKKAA
jgi:hypothetical protein